MSRASTVRLETPRLRLREMGEEDLDFIASLLADPEVMEWFGRLYRRPEALEWIRRQQQRYRQQGFGYWLAERRADAVPVGQAGIMEVPVDSVPEPALGWILARAWWGRGYATEAAAACRDHVLHALGRPRAVCLIRPGNEASFAVARRLGMRVVADLGYAGYAHKLLAVSREEAPEPGPAGPPPSARVPGAGPRDPAAASARPSRGSRPAP